MICKENATIIRALNKYGRVPQSHELLGEIENLQQELQRKDNIINELKEYLKLEIAEWQDVDNIPTRARVEEDKDILDKIKELETGRSDE